jgi:hypothetical protein
MTPWNNPRDINFYSTPSQDLDPDTCIRELCYQYHIQQLDSQPRYVHMALDYPVNYSTVSEMAHVRTHTDLMVTLRMPKSSYEALAVRHKREVDTYSHRYGDDAALERELYLRRNSAAVRKAYAQYRLTLQLAWEHEAKD